MRYGFQPPTIVIASAMNPVPTVIPTWKIFRSATQRKPRRTRPSLPPIAIAR